MSGESYRAGLGSTLADAKASGFFQWFHLVAVGDSSMIRDGETDAPGDERHRFRPSGPRFHPLVELELGVLGSGRITTACLQIDRAFIANAAIRPFARDITKSFLQWILPADAGIALESDIDAIGRFCDGESVVIVASSAARRSWPTGWFKRRSNLPAVFMERAVRAERLVGKTSIVFENKGNAWLQISVVGRRH